MALTNTTILLVNAYFIFSYIAIIIRRLYFHPLAGFPGPKFAAATSWYAFYYDAVKGGQFYREMKRMHDKYGPIVRINPKEVHILDASFYDEIYAPASKRRDKYDQWVVFPDVPTGAFATCPHEHHHIRRQALNLSFSKKVIYEIENLLVNKARRLCSRFEKMAQTGEEVRIDAAFFALANDIITQYTFGECYDCLTEDDFRKDFKRILLSAVETGAFVRQFPWLVGLVRYIPFWVLGRISRGFATILNWENIVRRRVETWMATSKTENQTEVTSVFSRLLTSDLPDSEKSFQRLVDEGKSLTGAGSETISWTLTLLIRYVTQDKEILENLRQDLNDMPRGGSGPSLLSWIDKRAYLDAAVTEALRLNHDALGRLTRVAQEPIQYGGRVIPPGTPLSSTNYFVHTDGTIFPDPSKFSPDRWLGGPSPLRKHMVSFSRGTRRCVGQNLALAELKLAAARLVTRYDFKFVSTDMDILPARDCFIPQPYVGTGGVRAKILKL